MEHTFAQQPSTGPNLTDWYEMSWFDAASLHAKFPGKYDIEKKKLGGILGWLPAGGVFDAGGSEILSPFWVYRAKIAVKPIKLVSTAIPVPYMVKGCAACSLEVTFWSKVDKEKAYEIIEKLVNESTI